MMRKGFSKGQIKVIIVLQDVKDRSNVIVLAKQLSFSGFEETFLAVNYEPKSNPSPKAKIILPEPKKELSDDLKNKFKKIRSLLEAKKRTYLEEAPTTILNWFFPSVKIQDNGVVCWFNVNGRAFYEIGRY